MGPANADGTICPSRSLPVPGRGRTTGGAGGASPLPGHLPGLDFPLLLGPLPRHPHGHPRGQPLPLGPDQQLLAQLLSCPWPGAVLDAFFLQVHAEYFTNCTGTGPPGLDRLPPGMAVAAAVGLSCLVPLAAALTLSRTRRGAQTPSGSCPAPACPRAGEGPATAPVPPSPGN
ncbi:uncharacterized protein LOC128919420 isoform X4 [Rissa tridactyla]|uniref:uncharacterized protein LOC128919420 isoform X4 n=1 Tax=Rissa tridactyla TaxID=75485 RepID=UPI0023BAC7FF|nr:uncharacterized protein LOC128919420 isoform X4 [Rissa tridactyla]